MASGVVEATWQTNPHRQEVAEHYSPREGGKGSDLGRVHCWCLGLIKRFALYFCHVPRFGQSERIHDYVGYDLCCTVFYILYGKRRDEMICYDYDMI